MICHPNAKINLGLNVTERRPDGYHNLETVFYPIPSVCDILQVETTDITGSKRTACILPPGSRTRTERTPHCQITMGGIPIDCPAEKNLLVKALYQLRQDADLPYLYIYINKQIPSGAGLGGGSADAAFMMKTLNAMFNLQMSDHDLEKRVGTLGADCAFFIRNRPMFATGIGNILTPVSLSLAGWYIAVVKPDIFVSTQEAYVQIRPQQPSVRITNILHRPVEQWKEALANDFEAGIFALHPAIAAIKEQLYQCGAAYAAMSGSGSSVYGLFRQEPDEEEMRRHFTGCFYNQALL